MPSWRATPVIVTHKTADGADGEVLTLKDYGNALVSGCALPPNAGGPCLKVAMVQDPVGRVMKVKGDTVVTEMVISMTDKGYPISVVNPGRSAISIAFAPVGSTPRQPGQHEVERQNQILAFGEPKPKHWQEQLRVVYLFVRSVIDGELNNQTKIRRLFLLSGVQIMPDEMR